MLKEFRDFIKRGNVLDLAVAVIIGAAFSAIVNSLANDIILPLIGVLLGGIDFTYLTLQVGDATIRYGQFIQAVVDFIVITFAIFMLIRTINRLQQPAPPPPPAPPAEVQLLTEIRDLLQEPRR